MFMKRKGDAVSPKEKLLTNEVSGSQSGAGSKTDLCHFKNKLFKVAVIVLAVICMAVCAVACEIKEEKTSETEQVEVQIENIDSVSEVYSLLGSSFALCENVVGAVKEHYGENNVLSIMSENSDGSGNIAVLVDDDGLKIAEVEIALTAQDFDAKKYKKDTFTLENKVITYYENSEKKTADLSDKFSYTDPQGDLYVVDVNKANEKILSLFENAKTQELNVRSDANQSELEVFGLLLGNVIDADKTVFCPTVNSVVYDAVNDVTKVVLTYAVSKYEIESCEITFQGDLTANGTLDAENAQEQFNEESAVFSISAKDYSKYKEYNILLSAEQAKGHIVSRIEKVKTLNFESWNEVFEIQPVQDKIIEILQDTLFTEFRIKNMFGNSMSKEDFANGNLEIFKWVFDIEGDQINNVQILGVRYGYPTEQSRRLQAATFTFAEPIEISQMQATINGRNNINVVQFEKNGKNYLMDLTTYFEAGSSASYKMGSRRVTDYSLTAEHEEIFDLVMPLAVEQGLIDEGDYNFVSVMALSSTNSEWGTTLSVVVKLVDIGTGAYKHLGFTFDHIDLTTGDECKIIQDAVKVGSYSCRIVEEYNFIEATYEDIVISLPSSATQTYTVKANTENLQ